MMNQEKHSKDSCYMNHSSQAVFWLIRSIDSKNQNQAKCLLKKIRIYANLGSLHLIFHVFHVASREVHACMFMYLKFWSVVWLTNLPAHQWPSLLFFTHTRTPKLLHTQQQETDYSKTKGFILAHKLARNPDLKGKNWIVVEINQIETQRDCVRKRYFSSPLVHFKH